MSPDNNLELVRSRLSRSGGWRALVGARVVSTRVGEVSIELEVGDQHKHEAGAVQGGFIAQIADAAMGLSALSIQPAGRETVTMEIKVSFLRSVKSGTIRADGRVVSSAGGMTYTAADVRDSENRLVARCYSACLIHQEASE